MAKGFSRFVKSSFIEAVSYDGSRLRIAMKGGNAYDYDNVPAHVARAVLNYPDDSVGQWYNHSIKQAGFQSRKVRGVTPVRGV